MTQQEVDLLFNDNLLQIDRMNIASGSMVKALIQAIESNGPTYIRLTDAEQNGHKVGYQVVDGDDSLLSTMASALGLNLSDSTIEVRHA